MLIHPVLIQIKAYFSMLLLSSLKLLIQGRMSQYFPTDASFCLEELK